MPNKKKGFTLIELLAIIVILAIIALILVPLISNIIIKARIKAAEDSALIYVKAIDDQNSMASLNKAEYIRGDDVDLFVEDINPKIDVKGKKPSEGMVTFDTDFTKVEYAELCINNYSIKYENREARYQPDEEYCIYSNESEPVTPQPFVEPEGEYVRVLCDGTSTYNKNIIYKVKKVEDMACLSKVVNEGNGFNDAQVQVVSDVDFKNTSDYVDSNTTLYGDINENGSIESLYTELTTGKGFKQISVGNNKFWGTFIGNMFTLSNITINRPEENDVGIFGFSNGDIKKLKIDKITITGNNRVGGLVGNLYSYKKVETIEATNVEVLGNDRVGGIVGEMARATGTINEIKFDTTVTGVSCVGGVVGYSDSSVRNVVGSSVVTKSGTGTATTIGGVIGYSNVSDILNGAILESGSSGKYTFSGRNSTYGSNTYYLEGYTAASVQGVIYDATASKNINAYETALDTIIGGDNDGTGYYFRFDENNKIQLVSVLDYPIKFTLKGSGTEEDPYLIGSIKEWNEATTKAHLAGTYFKLTKDLNFKGREFLKMGSPTTPFRGVLDGNNHKLKNVKIVGGAYQGVFGYLSSTSVVKDLTIENSKIEKASIQVGMLAGCTEDGVTIMNVKIPGTEIEAMGYAGGLIGEARGTISDLTLSNITVKSYSLGNAHNIGGIVGYTLGNIERLKINHIKVTAPGNNYVGGLVGNLYSYKKAETIEATNVEVLGNDRVGGIVGEMARATGTINEIKFDTTVTGVSCVGGVVGYSDSSVRNVVGSSVVTRSGTGTATTIGGVIGYSNVSNILDGAILESGSSGKYTISGRNSTYGSNTYYLEGYTAASVQGVIYDATASKNINAYETAIDTIIGGDNDGTGYYFRFDENNKIQLVSVDDYPINFTLSGTGTEEDPYLIGSVKEWNEATTKAQLVGTYFKLTANLDFTGKEFLKMGGPYTPFRGTFDGNNKTISGVKISGGSYQGVFGYLSSTSVVKDLTIENSKIEKASIQVGMLAGYTEDGATIMNVKIPGTEIEAMGYAGGLIGEARGTISDLTLSNITVKSYSLGNAHNIGGIVGYTLGNVERLKINHVKVTAPGNNYVGGVIGYLYSYKKAETIEATNVEVLGNDRVGGIVGEMARATGTINEIKFDTTVTGVSCVGGVVGYSDSSVRNVVGSSVVTRSGTGTATTIGGVIGYSNVSDILNGAILESGSSGKYTISGRNSTYGSNTYYLEGYTAASVQGTKWDASYLHDLTKYSEVVETSITGDTNGTGYYFDYNTDHSDIILKEAN